MIEAMGLKITTSRTLEWYYLHTKFYENLTSGSKVISGGHTDKTDRHTHRCTHTYTDRQTYW
jgi:hypothetical protein